MLRIAKCEKCPQFRSISQVFVLFGFWMSKISHQKRHPNVGQPGGWEMCFNSSVYCCGGNWEHGKSGRKMCAFGSKLQVINNYIWQKIAWISGIYSVTISQTVQRVMHCNVCRKSSKTWYHVLHLSLSCIKRVCKLYTDIFVHWIVLGLTQQLEGKHWIIVITQFIRQIKQWGIELSNSWLTTHWRIPLILLKEEQVNANIQGARIAHCVWEWAKTLQWPKEDIDNPPMAAWGITWFELMINFIIVSGEFPPIKSTGHGSAAIFVPYKSSEGAMQLSSRRMASHLCLAFQNLVQCVQSLSGVKIIPSNPRKKSASMLRLGFEGKILTSFPIRPVMQKTHETMTYVYQYIVHLNGAKILKLPLDDLVVDGILDVPHWEYETNAATRYRNYLKLRRIRKKHDEWICFLLLAIVMKHHKLHWYSIWMIFPFLFVLSR